MRIVTRIASAFAVIAAIAAAAPPSADADVQHTVKHRTHAVRHPHVHRRPAGVIYGQPVVGPSANPGYNYGGPRYSTCDRINADRMLVGTCR